MTIEKKKRGPRGKVPLDVDKFEELRQGKGWTLEDLADEAKLGDSTIKRAIHKEGEGVSRASAKRIADALGVELDTLDLRARIAEAASEDKELTDKAFDQIAQDFPTKHGGEPLLSDEMIQQRYADFLELADIFVSAYSKQTGLILEVGKVPLWEAVTWAYDEISKFKTYHLADPKMLISLYKSAAIFGRAISKFRPIWVHEKLADEKLKIADFWDDVSTINEQFAVFVALLRAEIREVHIGSEAYTELIGYLQRGGEVNDLAAVLKLLHRAERPELGH